MGKGEDHVEVADGQDLGLPLGYPLVAGRGLALRTMAVAAGNGELTITCLMGSIFLWGVGPRGSMQYRPFSQILTCRDSP